MAVGRTSYTLRKLCCCILFPPLCVLASATSKADGFPVRDVIDAINHEVKLARIDAIKHGAKLDITSVDIELSAITKYGGAGGINIEVPILKNIAKGSASAGLKNLNTQKLLLTLIPTEGRIPIQGSPDLGLLSVIKNVKSSMQSMGADGSQLTLSNFVFEIEFAITKTAQGNIKFIIFDANDLIYQNTTMQKVRIHMKTINKRRLKEDKK